MNRRQANRLLVSGGTKIIIGMVLLCIAVYILYWPPSSTAWLTDWLYRLQDPVDGSPPYEAPHDWRNVTAGLSVIVGGWTFFTGVADVVYDRQILLRSGDNG